MWSHGFHLDLETDISKTGKPRSLPFLFWKNNTSVNVQKQIKIYDQWPFSISTLLSQMVHCEKEMICWIRFDYICWSFEKIFTNSVWKGENLTIVNPLQRRNNPLLLGWTTSALHSNIQGSAKLMGIASSRLKPCL